MDNNYQNFVCRNINIWILAHYETDMFYSHTSVHAESLAEVDD